MAEKVGLRSIIFSGIVLTMIVLLSAILGVVVITYEPAETDMIYSVEDSGNAADGIYITSGGISYMYTNDYHFITNDRKSHAVRDMTIYRPVAPEGWYIVGDYCQPAYGNPTKRGVIIRADDDDLLAPPVDWELVWTDRGSGATRDTSIWKAVPPRGYVAIGMVAVQGYSKPVIPEYRCVQGGSGYIDYAITQVAWSTDGSPVGSKVVIYSLRSDSIGPWGIVDTNTFVAYSPYFTYMEVPLATGLKA